MNNFALLQQIIWLFQLAWFQVHKNLLQVFIREIK